mgnify:CR=1 FL=1
MEYEYGYIYGGLFVTGYCSFIHDYCRQHDVDKILFLSRDGDILKQAYELLYPETKFMVVPACVDGINRENWRETEEGVDAVTGEITRIIKQFTLML